MSKRLNARRIFHFHSGGFEASPGYTIRTSFKKEPMPGLLHAPKWRHFKNGDGEGGEKAPFEFWFSRRPAGLILTPDPFRTAVSQPQTACLPRLSAESEMISLVDTGAGRAADVPRRSVRATSVRMRGPRGAGTRPLVGGASRRRFSCYLFVSGVVPAWSFQAVTPRTFLLEPARPAVTASSRRLTLPPEVTGPGPSRPEVESWIPSPTDRAAWALFRTVPPELPSALLAWPSL